MKLTIADKKRILEYLNENDPKQQIVSIKPDKNLSGGELQYSKKIRQHREIKVISGDEEWVRAYLIVRLISELNYPINCIEIEKEYNIGRPKVERARIDIIVKDRRDKEKESTFLFIECKPPEKYESDKQYIEGQLYGLSSLENEQSPLRYLVYYTIDATAEKIKDNALIINYETYSSYEKWLDGGEFSLEIIPDNYGQAKKLQYICGDKEKDLDRTKDRDYFKQLRKELHDVLWGGTTDYNSIFTNLVKIFLAKIHDELNTPEGEAYQFQVISWDDQPEPTHKLFDRINQLYRKAQRMSLFQTEDVVSNSPGINKEKISENKVFFVVQKLQGISLTKNIHKDKGDLLGEFFEDIISQGFKQDKGTFFTHTNVVRFMLEVLNIGEYAASKINADLRLPFIIDPSCGSGTFLIEAMKFITKTVQADDYKLLKKTAKIKERVNGWFLPDAPNYWAREFIYGIEDDVDLALSTKVNMVLHGDGNINIFHRDGLKEFSEYKRISETGEREATKLSYSSHGQDGKFPAYEMNEQFEIIISNPPFSIKVTEQDQKDRRGRFYFNSRKNSENLFIERWYQLLAPQGRLAVVLPESVFDTTENKYIRLFLYRHFNIKAIVSLPQLTFEPYTSTKTSLLFATKKTKEEVGAWDAEWRKQEVEYSRLRSCETVKFILENEKLLNSGDCLNKLIADLDLDVYLNSNILDKHIFTNELKKQIVSSKRNLTDDKWLKKDKKGRDKIDTLLEEIDEFVGENKLNQIKDVAREISALKKLLKHHFPRRIKTVANDEEHEFKMAAEAEEGYYTHDDLKYIVDTAYDELIEIIALDYPDWDGAQKYTNSWWLFGEVTKELNTEIVFAEANTIGYKRTKRGEKPQPTDLYQTDESGNIVVDTINPKTILDFIRKEGLFR